MPEDNVKLERQPLTAPCGYVRESGEPCKTCPRKITMLYMCGLLQEGAADVKLERQQLMHNLTIQFPTEELRRDFASWLCNQGEQDWFTALDITMPGVKPDLSYRQENEKFPKNDKRRYGPFLADNTIRVTV